MITDKFQYLEPDFSTKSSLTSLKQYLKDRIEYFHGMRSAIRYGVGLALATSIIGSVHAEDATIRTIKPGSITLTPQMAGPSSAYVVGGAQQAGLYVITALYPAGVKSKPHVHPDQRIMTVISGTFYAGTGDKFDENKVQALEPGSILVIPPNTLHWGWAKDGDVVVEEVGIGPTGTHFPSTGAGQ